jgi:SAM-dependent methyltransferase
MHETAARYYGEKVRQFGATHRGVDWSTEASQTLRFDQLLRLMDATQLSTINDFGCGYGALLTYLRQNGSRCCYTGFDISESMIAHAVSLHADDPVCTFTRSLDAVSRAEITVASGVFNVKQNHGDEEWEEYVLENIAVIDRLSERGFAFNMLSSYSDPGRRRADLFYARPGFFFDYCKTHFSPAVALLHDYPLYEFTIVVRK